MKKFWETFFYSNVYLGVIAVVLCIETNVVSGLSLNYIPFYILIFLCTWIYYTRIYVKSIGAVNLNDRTTWYRARITTIISALRSALFLTAALLLFIVFRNRNTIISLTGLQFTLIFTFPFLAAWYTFSPRILNVKKIRQSGLIKPFIVGFTWAGCVTFYPIFLWQIQKGQHDLPPLFPSFFLWFQNFILFSTNAIIFDIKDYHTDAGFRLNTFPVKLGIQRTIRFIILPLFVLNIAAFTGFQIRQHFSIYQSLIQVIPYLIFLVIIFKLPRQKPLLYYLAAVDGLLLVKAFCGIASVLIFKK